MHKLPHVLVIDSDRDLAEGLATRLRSFGHGVHVAGDGRHGLRMALSERPDVILLDPGTAPINGLTTLAWLKSHHQTRGIPVAACCTDWEAGRRMLLAGARSCVAKPYEPLALVTAIQSALNGAEPRRETGRSLRVHHSHTDAHGGNAVRNGAELPIQSAKLLLRDETDATVG